MIKNLTVPRLAMKNFVRKRVTDTVLSFLTNDQTIANVSQAITQPQVF